MKFSRRRRANTWVRSVLSEGQLTKFADRDFTSAIIDYYSLRELGRSNVDVRPTQIDSVLNKYFSHNKYFDDITHTCIILASLSNIRSQISTYDECLAEVTRSIKEPEILNDSKNIVFAAILMESISQTEQLRNICSYALTVVESGAVQFSDRIYYAWVLWTYRQHIDETYATRIRSFTTDTIEGLRWSLSQPDTDDIYDVYSRF